jgi:hypothetical protein
LARCRERSLFRRSHRSETQRPLEYVFDAGKCAPSELFGMQRYISKTMTWPVVMDAQAFGKLYSSPLDAKKSARSAYVVRTDAVHASSGNPAFYEKVQLSDEEAKPHLGRMDTGAATPQLRGPSLSLPRLHVPRMPTEHSRLQLAVPPTQTPAAETRQRASATKRPALCPSCVASGRTLRSAHKATGGLTGPSGTVRARPFFLYVRRRQRC